MTNQLLQTALMLAQMCVAEISFTNDVRECEVMWSISQKYLSEHRTMERHIRSYNTYWKKTETALNNQAQRPWIRHLDYKKRPKDWPRTASWRRWRPVWLKMREAAIEWLKAGRPLRMYNCPHAIHYAAPYVVPRDKRLRRVRCLPLGVKQHQSYWERPVRGWK